MKFPDRYRRGVGIALEGLSYSVFLGFLIYVSLNGRAIELATQNNGIVWPYNIVTFWMLFAVTMAPFLFIASIVYVFWAWKTMGKPQRWRFGVIFLAMSVAVLFALEVIFVAVFLVPPNL